MSHQLQEVTRMCFALLFCAELLQDYAFFWDRSSGPKERGSSCSTVITSYVPSGFVRYAGHCVPNCAGKNRKLLCICLLCAVITSLVEDYSSCGLIRLGEVYSNMIWLSFNEMMSVSTLQYWVLGLCEVQMFFKYKTRPHLGFSFTSM